MKTVFSKIMHKLGSCDTDLFASRLDNQLSRYVAWEPHPYTLHIDSFSLDWSLVKGYIFPSFSLMHKILHKIELDQATCVVILPLWTSQPWFPKMLKMLCNYPILLPSSQHLIKHPLTGLSHPKTKMKLMACKLSGISSKVKEFQKKLPKLSWPHGEEEQNNATSIISKDGTNFVLNGKGVTMHHL